MINAQCPRCKEKLSFPDSLVGQSQTCPECGHAFTVLRLPDKARVKPATRAKRDRGRTSRPPTYFGTTLAACLLAALGFICLVAGTVWIIWHRQRPAEEVLESLVDLAVGLYVFTAGCLNLALAFGLCCLRDIATNTWHGPDRS